MLSGDGSVNFLSAMFHPDFKHRKPAQSGDRAGTNAILAIEPLNSTCRHLLLQSARAPSRMTITRFKNSIDDVFERRARGRIQQGTAANRTTDNLDFLVGKCKGRRERIASDNRGSG